MDTTTLLKIYTAFSESDDRKRANLEMEGKSLLKRWQIAERFVFEDSSVPTYFADFNSLDDSELKQLYSSLFPNFPAVKILQLSPLHSLKEENPELVPIVIKGDSEVNKISFGEDNEVLDVIMIPWYINPYYVEGFISDVVENLKTKETKIELDDVLDQLPFEFADDLRWGTVSI